MATYIGNVPVPQATQTRDRFVATSGQTTFTTSGYTPNYLDVFLNGVKLDTTDYTATDGTDVVLTTGATTGDVVDVIAFSTFESAALSTVAITGNYSDLNNIPELSSNALTEAFPVASGGSVTAGKAVSLNASGEVGEYPIINTLGSEYTIGSKGSLFNLLSTDGSRYITISNDVDVNQQDIQGYALSSSSNAITGSTTYSFSNSNALTLDSTHYAYAVDTDKFFCVIFRKGFLYGTGKGSAEVRLISVDASGNISVLDTHSWLSASGSTVTYNGGFNQISVLSNNDRVFSTYGGGYNDGTTAYTYVVDISAGTFSKTSDSWSEVYSYSGHTVSGVTVNSDTITVSGHGNTVYTGSISSGNLGPCTTSSANLPSYSSGGDWYFVSLTTAVVHYIDDSNNSLLALISIDQTTGAVTLVDTAIWKNVYSLDRVISENNLNFLSISRDSIDTFTVSSNSFDLNNYGNIKVNTTTIDNWASNSSIEISDTNAAQVAYYTTSNSLVNTELSINAYSTEDFIIAGISQDTTSSGNTNITVSGVVTGLTGLTPAQSYYIDTSTYDGSITTDSSGTYVGKAISSTKLLLGFN